LPSVAKIGMTSPESSIELSHKGKSRNRSFFSRSTRSAPVEMAQETPA
jgi:hypothetical protein